ncbi:3-deoxy-7-phosphoheptulonate synthase [Streptomyces sp. NPDC127051]|uniref:3-deoxy-7-phosphoheptulonate synthase n=1 Tax=Streptomyces sp. NPDC127051 TaxID=3347119 RepID=UPI0036612F34
MSQLETQNGQLEPNLPYKLVRRRPDSGRSPVRVGGAAIGPGQVVVIAGPCAVESKAQTLKCALAARRAGATALRGGAFKPRTSPYSFQGLGREGLQILAEARDLTGLPVVTEVIDPGTVSLVAEYADMLQIGARNMQNFSLLRAVGSAQRPVLLKRGMSATIEEWILAAEYIAEAGNSDIVLCERGIRTFEPFTRSTLDLSSIPLVQNLTHLPVIVDPSHAVGRRDLVLPLSMAAVAVGADGLLVDIHPEPGLALCDGEQALSEQVLRELIIRVMIQARNVNRTLDVLPLDTLWSGNQLSPTEELEDQRGLLDALDQSLWSLVAERTRVVERIASVKRRFGLAIRDQQREKQVHDNAAAAITRYGLNPATAYRMAKLLIADAVRMQTQASAQRNPSRAPKLPSEVSRDDCQF